MIKRREKWATSLSRKPWRKFAALLPVLSADTVAAIKELNAPRKICGTPCPANLQRVNYGTLITLQSVGAGTYYETATNLVAALFPEIKRERIDNAPAADVLGVVAMIAREMERIGKLFATLNNDPTPEEQRAGVELLQFGAFGIADYYAKRMGITDHETAFKTPWARIFKCLSMDKARGDYEKRLRNILQNNK